MTQLNSSKKVTVSQLENIIGHLVEIIEHLDERLDALEATPKRDRGPKSTRDMTEDDARRLILGDLKDLSHKKAAQKLGLSYGQVYSARGGYTFKNVTDEKLKSQK